MSNAVCANLPAEDEALRASVRDFLTREMPSIPLNKRARTWMGYSPELSRKLGERGWIGSALPSEYGGGGRSPLTRYVIIEELLAAGAPVGAHWIAERQSAPLILRYGTEEQRRRIVPGVCRGEIYFCAGLSEPGTGSDLAGVRTRAERSADGWRLNGAKLWTSHAMGAHYMIALVRTSGGPDDRHAGLSQVLVDMKSSGVSVSPIRDAAGDEQFAEVHFDDVQLPSDALIGAEGRGWAQVNEELALERAGPERYLSTTVVIDAWLAYLRRRGDPREEELRLAGWMLAEMATLRKMSFDVTASVAAGADAVQAATIVKDLGTTFEQAVCAELAEHLAEEEGHELPPELDAAVRYLQTMSPSFSIRGGTREILRGIIARGLGLR